MAITVDTKHRLDDLAQRIGLVAQDKMRAGVNAINGSIRSTTKDSATILRRHYGNRLKIGSIKRQIRDEFASPRQREIRGAIDYTTKRFRLFDNFTRVQTRAGVRLTNPPWRIENLEGDEIPLSSLAHAFIAKNQVWIRIGRRRLPITALLAPSLTTTVREWKLMPTFLTIARTRFNELSARVGSWLASKRG